MRDHDPMIDTVQIRYPKDDPDYGGAVMGVAPNNGRSSVQNAGAVHPNAVIFAWGDGVPYTDEEHATFGAPVPNEAPPEEKPDKPTPPLTPPTPTPAIVPLGTPLTPQTVVAEKDAGQS